MKDRSNVKGQLMTNYTYIDPSLIREFL